MIRTFQKYRRRVNTWLQANARYLMYKLKYKNPGHPGKELVIDIHEIKARINDRQLSKQSLKYRRIYKAVNIIIQGEFWDHLQSVEKDSLKLKGFQEHFNQGLKWRDTSLFKDYEKKLKEGMKVQGCRELDEVVRLYEQQHDPLYAMLKSDGLKSARGNPDISPIYVYIYKDGSFVYTSGGNHRLNMAKVLGIKKMPVYIRGRHIEWQAIREELYRLGPAAFLKIYPSLAGHPDLFD